MHFETVSVIIAVIAVIVSIATLICTKIYNRKKDTLDGFNRLQKEVLDRLNEYSDDDIKKTACHAEKLEDEKYREITVLLARIEHFAVGANTRIYNVRIIKRCAGKYFINLYKKLDPMIEQKKNKRPKAKHYDEFETLTKKLTRMYEREERAKKIKNFMNFKDGL